MWTAVKFISRSKLFAARFVSALETVIVQANIMNKSHGKKQPKIKPKQRKVHNFTTTFQGNEEHEVLSTPVKSASDIKSYRVIRLKNGLTACLISHVGDPQSEDEVSDSETGSESEDGESGNESSEPAEDLDHNDDVKMTKVPQNEQKVAAAALCVGVGSFSDPKDLPGLAHFVEHMVFMGSEKYPKENDFDSYIKKRGGSDNASTESECSTFYFECLEKHLFQGLDKFSQFFISPLMKEESMTRERQAIESEFQMAVASDSNRREQLLLNLMNPEVPINSFAWGNIKTLQGTVDDKEIYSRLHEFRKRHYSAHRMTVAVQARLPLDALQTYVIKCFSNVPNNNMPPLDFKKYSDVIFNTPAFNRLYYILPMKDIMEVNLVWPLPSLLHMYKSKPHEYVSHLLGNEGKGSLLSFLKQKVWALDIYSGNDESGSEYNSIYSFFTVAITLTMEGVHHLSDVIDAVYSYIRLIKTVGPDERTFNEIKLIQDTSFRFTESDSPVENVEDLCEDMQFYPPEDYLCGNQLYFTYDPEAIKMILSNLVPDKMNVTVLSSTLPHEIKYDKIEPYFGAQYTDVDIPNEWKENWHTVLPFPEFAMPSPNKFLTSDFTLLPDIADNPMYPQKILETPLMELWYRKDQTFQLPSANYCYSFITPLIYETAINSCMTDMFVSLLGLQLCEDIYPAITAELGVEMYVGDRGIILKLDGYNEKLPLLLEMVVTFFKDVARNLNEDLFNAVKDKQKGLYYNKFLKPSALAKDVRFSILLEKYWTLVEKHSAISSVTFDMMKTFADDLVKTLYIQCLIQGNVDRDTALKASRMVLDVLQCKPLESQPKIRVAQLPSGEYHCRVRSFNKKDANSVISNYYQAEQFSFKTSATIEILMMIIEEPLFDILRTKEQLGYHVSCTMRDTFGMLGYSIAVNAQKKTTQHVDHRIEAFVRHVNNLLKKMSANKLNETKRDLIKLKRCADDNLKEEVTRNWGEIVSQKYLFDRLQREIDAIQDIKIADVRQFWREHNTFINHSAVKKLSIQVVGYDDDKNADLKDTVATAPVNIEDHYSLQLLGPEDKSNYFKYFIGNVKEFKDKKCLAFFRLKFFWGRAIEWIDGGGGGGEMQRKAFQVQVELDVQAITCPGVWLCPVGKISLQLYMLDSCIQTASADPVFPVLCHEKFIFYKTFYAAQKLSELQKLLNRECLYIELIQWQTCELGTVLATFQTNLCELLYPSVHEGAIPGVDVDLLMEPNPNFPGVIAPKIEVCTKTVVEDTVCDGKKESAFVVNPKVIQSKGGGSTTRTGCPHQRKVCHSAGYNRSRKRLPKLAKGERPVFTYRKVDDDLLSRKPQGLAPLRRETCKCRSNKVKNDVVLRTFTETCRKNTNYFECANPKTKAGGSWPRPNFFSKVTNCLCPDGHDVDRCPVCSKYTYYFEDFSATSPRTKKTLDKRGVCQKPQGGGVSEGSARVVRCRCAQSHYNNKSCQCGNLKPKQSLAEKLHQRLTQTLDTCADSFDGCRNDDYSDSQRLSYVTFFPIIWCVCLTMILTGLIWLSKLFIIVTHIDAF